MTRISISIILMLLLNNIYSQNDSILASYVLLDYAEEYSMYAQIVTKNSSKLKDKIKKIKFGSYNEINVDLIFSKDNPPKLLIHESEFSDSLKVLDIALWIFQNSIIKPIKENTVETCRVLRITVSRNTILYPDSPSFYRERLNFARERFPNEVFYFKIPSCPPLPRE